MRIDFENMTEAEKSEMLKGLIADKYAAQEDLKALQAQTPPEGSRVLTAEQAEEWRQYRELGEPADITKAFEDHAASVKERAGLLRDQMLYKVADVEDMNRNVLKTLAGDDLDISVTTAKDSNGREVERAIVRDEYGDAVPVEEYAKKHWPEFLPALKTVKPAPQQKGGKAAPTPREEAPSVRRGPDPDALKVLLERSNGRYSRF